LIRDCGIDSVVTLKFDDELASLAPEEFVAKIIDDGLGAQFVVVGANFAFGKNRAGSTEDLRRLSARAGIETDILDEVELGGEVVSSTRIREHLRDTDVSRAADLLDRNHRITGTIEKGAGRGREIGYPTANLAPKNLVPGDGIYATYLHVPDRGTLPAASSIGTRPTFDDEGRTVEAYVLDRDDLDLYGETVELEFVEFVRPEREFSSADPLTAQMEEDVEAVRNILKDSSPDQ